MDDVGGNCGGSFKVEHGSDAAEISDIDLALDECGHHDDEY